MPLGALAGVTVMLAWGAACPSPATPVPCPGCDVDHPINKLLAPGFQQAGHVPTIAGPQELCARLAIDLLGAPLDADTALATCSGHELDDVIIAMQGTDAYLVTSERHWADRFLVNDVAGDWRSIHALFDLVDELHRGELDYHAFAVQAVAHPGLMTDVTDLDARGRVRRVFRSFLGRTSTDAEEVELSSLFRPWIVRAEPDIDFPVLYRYTPIIMSGLCEPLAQCSTTMWGGAALEFPVQGDFVGIPAESLDDATRAVLRVPGELVAAQPTFYEAAADEILNRLLDWDDGERAIRTPGFLFPEVREAVADYLRDTGDYPGAERLVLTSWLYTQTTTVTDGVSDAVAVDETAPPPAQQPQDVGPTKTVPAEVWLAGLQQVTSVPLGGCDNRYGDGFPYFQLAQALQDGVISVDQNNDAMEKLFSMRADRGRLTTTDGVVTYDYLYTFLARMLGGCPGFQATRQRPAGVSYAILEEGIAEAYCSAGVDDRADPDGAITPETTVRHLVPLLLSRAATDDDVAAVTAVVPAGATPSEIVSETCTAIVGGAEFLFR